MDCDRQTDFEELDRQDCLELLREECVGRVALHSIAPFDRVPWCKKVAGDYGDLAPGVAEL